MVQRRGASAWLLGEKHFRRIDGHAHLWAWAAIPGWETTIRTQPSKESAAIERILREREALALPLARLLLPFRDEVCRQIVKRIAEEDALFWLLTALPNVVPSPIELPWAAGEFASDTAILTANQVRMAFLLAAANDRQVGCAAQKIELGSIIAGAFGWRARSRELVGKVPLGGGLIPKAAVAYAGT
jgi:hypothetical protein